MIVGAVMSSACRCGSSLYKLMLNLTDSVNWPLSLQAEWLDALRAAFRSAKSGSTSHDRDRVTRNAATRLSFVAGRSTAPLALAQISSGHLSRAPPPRRISSHCQRRTLTRYAPTFQIVFDGHRDHSPTDAGDSQIPMARFGDGALPPRGCLPWRFSNAGPLSARRQPSVKGRHPKIFTEAAIRALALAA